MKSNRPVVCAAGVVLLSALFFSTGCSYMQKRGNDALDFMEFGITVSKKPQLSLYVGLVNVVSLGYSNVDGTLLGIAHRDAGALPMRHKAGGILLKGREQLGYEDVDWEDPNSPEPWQVGIIPVVKGASIPKHELLNCPKLLHLGWVGITLNCHFAELADFFLGWTTLDIMGDDGGGESMTADAADEQ